jgi:putative methyltransferase
MRVAFVELSAVDGMLPLASGYMQAFASKDDEVRERCSFSTFARVADAGRETILAELSAQEADVYAIGCYIWNMGVVKSLLPRLREARPSAYFICGGPQVINHAAEYIPRDYENVTVCNGEGERTFYSFLKQLLTGDPDFTAVQGLSFVRHGQIITTEPAPRINDLAEIPSPFTAGIFEAGKYTNAVLETTRGCPFRCGFCFWGAATNDRVHRFDEQRVRADIDWIAQTGCMSVEIIDANWGMLPRDVELTKHIVDSARKNGFPMMVYFASAKNSPERVAEIAETLVSGGLLTSQAISLQTMSDDTLDLVDRANIKRSAYEDLQRLLRNKGISSYIELIWPLPGETLASFQSGIAELCRSGADTLIVYPQLLLHNTPIYRNQDRLGVKTKRTGGEVAEADVVVQTKWVDHDDYANGVWYFYAAHCLYNLRGLYYLSTYLDVSGRSSFEKTLAGAGNYFRVRTDTAICKFLEESVTRLGYADFHNLGTIAHFALHEHREEFDSLLAGYVEEAEWYDDNVVRAALELDLVARPYIYAEPVRLAGHDFEYLDPRAVRSTGINIAWPDILSEPLGPFVDHPIPPNARRVLVEHRRRRKLPLMERQGLRHNLNYCAGMIMRMREVLPTITALGSDGSYVPTDSPRPDALTAPR